MQDIKGDNATRTEKQVLNEASISQLNELQLSPHDGTKAPLGLGNFLGSDAIPKGHCIPKTNLKPPLEPLPAVPASGPPSLTYAPTLPTEEFETAPLQRQDSNEATCDSNSQHSAGSSTGSSTEFPIPSEAKFNGHVAAGMAQHLPGRFIALEEDQQQRTSTIELSLTQEEESCLKLNDEVTAVLHNDLTSTLTLANEDDDLAHSTKSSPSVPDRHFPPPLRQNPSRLASKPSWVPQKSSSDVDGAPSTLVQGYTSTSMTDAVQDLDSHGNEIASSDDLGQGLAVRNARQERIILIGLFTQLMFYGILLTLLMLQTLHPGLLQV